MIVLTEVLDGTVTVDADNVIKDTLVLVVVTVADGVFVTVYVAVGVDVIVTGGPATI